MIRKLAASAVLAAVVVGGVMVTPAGAAQGDKVAPTCVICWPVPTTK